MKKKKIKNSTIFVILSFVLVLGFTIGCMVLESKGVMISDTLIEWVFKFFGLEMIALSGIKISNNVSDSFGKGGVEG